MNNWQEIGYGLQASLENNLVFIRNPKISQIPQLKLELDSQNNNIIDFRSLNGQSAGGVEARYMIISLVKEKIL